MSLMKSEKIRQLYRDSSVNIEKGKGSVQVMSIFNKTRDDEREFEMFTERVDQIYNSLKPYENEVDLFDIASLKKSFIAKTEDFFREDRKLNIGIIGRVKAGKSTFLNSLLFQGKDILPTAVTPKTAALTRIEYGEKNALEVEYYSPREWDNLTKSASDNGKRNDTIVAKEIMKLVAEAGIDAQEYITRGTDRIEYGSYEEMKEDLNQYIGENGKITPIVKCVTIYVNNEDLEEISVVDTPGLYDPVVSRVDRTRHFIELCDVVFFLSKSTAFLDRNDIDLMASQLPKKGVKRMILVCSRFDDGLRDTLWNKKSLEEAIADTKKKLLDYTTSAFNAYKKNNYYVNGEVLEQCMHPVFVSSIADLMSRTDEKDYTEQMKKVKEDLDLYHDLNNEKLKEIGNMDVIREMFEEVLDDKEEMLQEKSSAFIPTAKEELKDKLRRIETLAEKRINQLHNYDREKLYDQKQMMNAQITRVSSGIEITFQGLLDKIEKNKVAAMREIRALNRDYLQVKEKEGSETHFEIRKVSTSVWFAPWTWGTSKREIYSYDEKYVYIDVFDALENIRNFVEDGSECIEKTFHKSVDSAYLKHELLKMVVENMDLSGENYDADYYKLLVERTIQGITLPTMQFSASNYEGMITAQFNGEIKGNANKSNFRAELGKVIDSICDEICRTLEREVIKFRTQVEQLRDGFAQKLMEDVNRELQLVEKQFANKEEEIVHYEHLIGDIRRMSIE